MSTGGSSNLSTLLIQRLDTALGASASKQSQLARTAHSDAVLQLASSTGATALHNQGGRAMPETIDRVQAQTEKQQQRSIEGAKLRAQQNLLGGSRDTRPSTAGTPSAPTTLSQTARTILALIAQYPDHAPPANGRRPLIIPASAGLQSSGASLTGQNAASTGAPSASTPAPSTQTLDPTLLASTSAGARAVSVINQPTNTALATLFLRALPQAVQQSGVFYESHLHDLTFHGQYSSSIKAEPQAQLGRSFAQAAQANPATTHGSPGAGVVAQDIATQAASSTHSGIHPDTQPIVRQQLEVLATQVFSWQGEAWPDAPMEWEVARQNEEGLADEDGTHWATRLLIKLPVLGEVQARLSLHNKQIVMQIVAPHSASQLQQHDQDLRAEFRKAGLTLSQLSIHGQEIV